MLLQASLLGTSTGFPSGLVTVIGEVNKALENQSGTTAKKIEEH